MFVAMRALVDILNFTFLALFLKVVTYETPHNLPKSHLYIANNNKQLKLHIQNPSELFPHNTSHLIL